METGKRCYVDRVGRNKWALNLFSKNNGARERTRRPGLRPRDDGSASEGPEEGGEAVCSGAARVPTRIL